MSASSIDHSGDRTLWVDALRQHLLLGQPVRLPSTPFLVRRPRQEFSPSAGPYVKCELGDQTGWIEAVWWDGGKQGKEELTSLLETPVWAVAGVATLNHYGGKKTPQIKVDSAKAMEHLDPQVVPGLVRRSASTEDELSRWLVDCIAGIGNRPLSALLEETIGSAGPWHIQFLRSPAALFYHHAYLGGLADHVREMVAVWKGSQDSYPKVDSDLTVTGILLHDIGKLDTFSPGSAPQIARAGQYVDHISAGIARLSLAMDHLQGFPVPLKEQLLHIIASHHGEKEHGSPVVPATREAIVVHHLDRLSSLLCHLEEWTRQSGTDQDGWTTENSPWLKRPLAGNPQIPDDFEAPDL